MVQLFELAGRVPGIYIDLAALERRQDDFPVTQVQLVVDRVAAVDELLSIELGEDAALGKVETGDGERPLWRARRTGRRRAAAGRGDDRQRSERSDQPDGVSNAIHAIPPDPSAPRSNS